MQALETQAIEAQVAVAKVLELEKELKEVVSRGESLYVDTQLSRGN